MQHQVHFATLATAKGGSGNSAHAQYVAVLKVRDGAVTTEASVMLGLGRHPHLLRFLGLCKDGPDQLMVTEYAAMGALDKLIERLDEEADETIPFQHKHAMLNQVASGMQALAAEKLIHRDLATRNILVFGYDADDVSQTVVKVADFGLTVNGHTRTAAQAYVPNEGAAKPIRYLAPEALQKGSYSEKTDVWAFGVLAWELLTDGNRPYFMIPEDDAVIAHVLGGGRLAQPTRCECPDEGLWETVESCWMVPKKYRPTFAMLAVQLGQLQVSPPPTATRTASSRGSADSGGGRGAVDGVGRGCGTNDVLPQLQPPQPYPQPQPQTQPQANNSTLQERSYRLLENKLRKGLEHEAARFNRVQESTVAAARRATVTVQQLGAAPSSETKLKGRAKEQQPIGIKSALLGRTVRIVERTAQFVQQQSLQEFFLQQQQHQLRMPLTPPASPLESSSPAAEMIVAAVEPSSAQATVQMAGESSPLRLMQRIDSPVLSSGENGDSSIQGAPFEFTTQLLQLVEMGFDVDKIKPVLSRYEGDVQQAVEALSELVTVCGTVYRKDCIEEDATSMPNVTDEPCSSWAALASRSGLVDAVETDRARGGAGLPEPAEQAQQPVSSASWSAAANPVLEQPQSTRIDPTDGNRYTQDGFYDCYNGLAEWDAAGENWTCSATTGCLYSNFCSRKYCKACGFSRQFDRANVYKKKRPEKSTSTTDHVKGLRGSKSKMPGKDAAPIKKKKKKKAVYEKPTGKDIKALIKQYQWEQVPKRNQGTATLYVLTRGEHTFKTTINWVDILGDSRCREAMCIRKYKEVMEKSTNVIE